MVSQFAAITNKEISQTIKQAVPEIHEEGDEIWFGSLRQMIETLSVWLEFVDETGEKGFCLQMQINSCVTVLYLADMFINMLKTNFNRLLRNGFKYKKNS